MARARAMSSWRLAVLLALLATPNVAWAGPPYVTDDPQPTDVGHWEIYAFATGAEASGDLAGEAGLDINYGAANDLQVTSVIPASF